MMATTTIQKPNPAQMDPRLRRAVYAKYREMLVSKHNQANEMIKQLPAYMVREDRGFNNTMHVIGTDIPPPPPPMSGNLPVQRLQTQISEAPACVQNAMMTKDKKPFTYTPGGIDLSQIKSPRMAKRISANANSPGITNQPKVSPLAQMNNNDNNSSPMQTPQTPQSGSVPPPPPPLPSMGAAALGMPFQVLPTGSPVKNQHSSPQSNGKNQKSFEPPPMGCRPEIKIPSNPMTILRKSPRPQAKGDYWVQEYLEEKPRTISPTEDEVHQEAFSSPLIQQQTNQSSPSIQSVQKQVSPTQYVQRSPSPPEHKDISGPIRNMMMQEIRTGSPTQSRSQVMSPSPAPPNLPPPITPTKTITIEPIAQPTVYRQPQVYQPPQQQQQQQLPQQPQQPLSTGGKIILSTMPNRQQQQAHQLESLYIPPPMGLDDKQFLLNLQSPPWMSSSKQNNLDTPEWANRDEVDNFIQQARMTQNQQASGLKEHVIPISFEKSPNKTPAMPGFGPTPFYGAANQQFNNVVSPKVDPNVNQFVNQGYNNIEFPQTQIQQQQQQPKSYVQTIQIQRQPSQQQPAGTRIIPIQVEGARAPYNDQTIAMQSDPRSPASPRMNAIGQPNQSRSFKILQQITDTLENESDDNSSETRSETTEEPMQEQKPSYSRPLGPQDMNESQLRRLQMTENDRAFMNRVKTQAPSRSTQRVAPQDENDGREPHLYQGSAIPSRSFKMLQTMTQPENAGPGLSDL